MPVHALATADTLPASDVSSSRRGLSPAGELVSAAVALRAHLSRRTASPKEIVRDVAERAKRLGRVGAAQRQHLYQKAIVSSGQAASPLEWTASTLAAGFYRLELEVPARMRLWKWRARRAVQRIEDVAVPMIGSRRSHRLARRVLPLLLILGASVACSLVSKDGGGKGNFAMGPLPELSKSKAVAPPAESKKRDAPWNYILPVDHGVRADKSGQGHFRAPRFHGEHNGLDLLAPVGTPTFSPCDGKAMTGVSPSFGRWAHIICPVPDEYMKAGGPHPWASFFYAHLDTVDLAHNKWVDVGRAQVIGKVGKSGNARGPNIQPHLHLELIVQKNRRAAMDERHLGSDQSSVPAADYFAESLSSECMGPYGFESKSQLLRRARRIDPFIALTCLSEAKPNFIKAPSPLSDASLEWTRFYVAKDFNVNLGVEDSRLAKR